MTEVRLSKKETRRKYTKKPALRLIFNLLCLFYAVGGSSAGFSGSVGVSAGAGSTGAGSVSTGASTYKAFSSAGSTAFVSSFLSAVALAEADALAISACFFLLNL